MKIILLHIVSLMVAAQMCEVFNANCQERNYNKLISLENLRKIEQNIKTTKRRDARKGTVLQSHCTPIIVSRFNWHCPAILKPIQDLTHVPAAVFVRNLCIKTLQDTIVKCAEIRRTQNVLQLFSRWIFSGLAVAAYLLSCRSTTLEIFCPPVCHQNAVRNMTQRQRKPSQCSHLSKLQQELP